MSDRDCELTLAKGGLGGLVARVRHWYRALCGAPGAPAVLALVDQVIVGVTNFVTLLLIGRMAGADALGVFALIMTVFYFMLAVQESLITVPFTIFCSRLNGVRQQQFCGSVLLQSTAWSAAVAVALAAAGAAVWVLDGDMGLARVLASAAFAVPLLLLREFARRYLFARMQLTRVVAVSLAAAVVQVAATIIFAWSGRLTDATALVAMGIGAAAGGFGWLLTERKTFDYHAGRNWFFVRRNWRFGRWLLASQGTSIVAANMMPWVVVLWLGPSATGVFAACDSILRFANPMIAGVMNLLTPKVAIGYSRGGIGALQRIVWKSTLILGAFLLTFCLFLYLAGEWLLQRSFGAEFSGYWVTLVVLGFTTFVAKLSIAPARGLLTLERTSILLVAEVAGVVAALVATIGLLPLYGILGAAVSLLIGSVASTALTMAVYTAAVRDETPRLTSSVAVAAPAGGFAE